MPTSSRQPSDSSSWEADEERAAALEAAAIGGIAGDEHLDPAQRPLIESGEGEAEGFELAEQDLITAAEFGDPGADPLANAFRPETGREPSRSTYGEADHAASAETRDSDW